jgi:peptide chain release factor 1
MAYEAPREMIFRLEESKKRFDYLNEQLGQPEVISNRDLFHKTSKERSQLEGLVSKFDEFARMLAEYQGARDMLQNERDADLRGIASEEIQTLEPELSRFEQELQYLLLPKDPNDEKNIILELRAGVGGDEAGIFAGDLSRMYTRYAESRRWRVEILSLAENSSGGYKEIILSIEGQGVYSRLKYETGVHRVQRVPKTEASGRVHTSTATVAVLPEAEEVDIQIEAKDLRIDVFRAGGHGGQSVNTTDSAVRITHLPTNTVVVCQDEKSQLKNKNKAMKVLRSRIYERALEERNSAIAAERRQQVGTGMRNERIRTYNFPQGRVTDHRIGKTTYNIAQVVQGDLDEFIDAITNYYHTLALKGESAIPLAIDADDDN